MRYAVITWQCICENEKCERTWLARSETPPAQCPSCKSTKWDKTGEVDNPYKTVQEKFEKPSEKKPALGLPEQPAQEELEMRDIQSEPEEEEEEEFVEPPPYVPFDENDYVD